MYKEFLLIQGINDTVNRIKLMLDRVEVMASIPIRLYPLHSKGLSVCLMVVSVGTYIRDI
jgi:hypothetical protein